MSEIGESSRAREEESQDIHIVYKQLSAVELTSIVTVVGREFEPEIDPDEDPKEIDELGGDSDGPLSSSPEDDLFEELHDRNLEL